MSSSSNGPPLLGAPPYPMLNPALRKLWRDERTLQLGLDPDQAVVVHDIDAATRALIESLDGRHSQGELLAEATGRSQDVGEATRLLNALRQAGVLTDSAPGAVTGLGGPAEVDRLAPDLASFSLLARRDAPSGSVRLRRRRASHVVIQGATRVGVPLAAAVAAAGVGRVAVLDSGRVDLADTAPGGLLPADENRPRRRAAEDAIRRAAPTVLTGTAAGEDPPDLVVLCDPWSSAEDVIGPLHAATSAHLVATVRETTGVIGPLVRPGVTSCLRCCDLHRTDRDPAWPALLAQLTPHRRRAGDPLDGPLGLLMAAAGAIQVLAHLDGVGVGAVDEASLEISLPDWRLRRRSWPPHPRCRCRSVVARSAG